MLSLLGGNLSRGRRANKIFFKGRYVKYPFENGLYDLDPQDRFECLYHYIENRHPAPPTSKSGFTTLSAPAWPKNTCCRITRRSGTSQPPR